jgi:hypothetical protein
MSLWNWASNRPFCEPLKGQGNDGYVYQSALEYFVNKLSGPVNVHYMHVTQ